MMTIQELQRIRQVGPGDGLARIPLPGDRPAGPAFSETLSDAVRQVDGAQKAADAQIEAFVAGEQESLHEVMIRMNEAELHFQLMTEVRNRMLETYQELMRLQV